jgi:hypothetical protein
MVIVSEEVAQCTGYYCNLKRRYNCEHCVVARDAYSSRRLLITLLEDRESSTAGPAAGVFEGMDA